MGRPADTMRRLHLERDEDVSGVSGVGVVAYGVEFPDGSIVLRWDTQVRSTVHYDSRSDLETITGHGGRTRIVYDDPRTWAFDRAAELLEELATHDAHDFGKWTMGMRDRVATAIGALRG